jgi:2-haloacid dehalogenase
MKPALAFDVYGTLIDTCGVRDALEKKVGSLDASFTKTWRAKQLEYSFRRALMQKYVNFTVCTRNALDFTCLQLNTPLSEEDRNELMLKYLKLPAFPDVVPCLVNLKSSDYRLFALSNGTNEDLTALLNNAGISHFFEDIISVDEIKTYKPNPAVYEHFINKTNSIKKDSYLISSNPFDVIGALSASMQSVWVNRDPETIFDPWEIKPTETINDLSLLIKVLNIH